jgi:anionic cell wall polymer biosynthesis LytR-Cps2A-Psr (LCP) family protein
MTISFDPGPQHLSGEEVMQYARSRKSTSDFDRSRRQMEVLMAMRTAAKSPGVIPRLPKLVPTVLDTVDTDFSTSEILSLAPIARSLSGENITTLRMDANVVYDDILVIDSTPQYVLRHRQDVWDEVRRQFLDLSPPPTPTPEPTAAAAPVP